MIVSYILSLVSVYVLGIVINALAPTFSSKQDINNAMKLAVFSMTASWVGGIFNIIPVLGILAMLAGLYGLYILYLGFNNPLMETPKDKVIGYFAVSLVIAIVLIVVISLILGAIFTVGTLGGRVL
jgi:peptidoglycan biosynthesis protein MviN/MurJ (putative lipid II flippase)